MAESLIASRISVPHLLLTTPGHNVGGVGDAKNACGENVNRNLGLRLRALGIASNRASTDWFAFIVTMHGLVAAHPAPVKPANREPPPGVAVSATFVPSVNAVEQPP